MESDVRCRIPMPRVLLVGGADVDARLELMHRLKGEFELGALGARNTLRAKFAREGFGYWLYPMTRRVAPFSDLMTFFRLFKIFRRLRPDIVHTFDTKPGVWGPLAARLARVPVVINTITGVCGSLCADERLKTTLVRRIYLFLQCIASRLCDTTVFQNRDDARELTTSGVVPAKRATIILGSGVSTKSFCAHDISESKRTALRRELNVRPGEVLITMVSRVIRLKGVLEFAEAARRVRALGERIRFVLVGGDDPESFDRLLPDEMEELKRSVQWVGPRKDVSAILAVTDVFVFPSAYREGIPRVLLEAASMGLPMVTTDMPGCREVVEEGVNGCLVPVHDTAALTKAIMLLVQDSELRSRFGRASRARALELFDLSLVANQTLELYESLLAVGRRKRRHAESEQIKLPVSQPAPSAGPSGMAPAQFARTQHASRLFRP